MSRYADVIMPLPLYSYFTYSIPDEYIDSISVGSRVIVPFGRSKYYTAIVAHLHDVEPKEYIVKDISSVLDESSIVIRPQLQLWEWISQYYMCSMGDVYKSAIPTGLKIESETNVSPNPDFEEDVDNRLTERELLVMNVIVTEKKMSVSQLEKKTTIKNIVAVIRSLLDKDAVFVSENLVNSYRPRTESYVTITLERDEKQKLHTFFDAVKQAKKQEALLLSYLDMSQYMRVGDLIEVSKKALIDKSGVTSAVLNAMVQKGIFRIYKKEISRFVSSNIKLREISPLSEEQNKAYYEILDSFKVNSVVLLHGVTSSGKTEVYMHLIRKVLDLGKQVLYLVPEIALTTQLTQRLEVVFGDSIVIYHSKFSDAERVEIWNKLLKADKPYLIVGVRSSIFLPFKQLGLVIVDEEHDSSYKQYDPAPRYNAKNAAILLSRLHGAKTLLGTATPSVESYFNALSSRYGLVKLLTRYEGIQMPAVEIINSLEARKQKAIKGVFTTKLITDARQSLSNGEQVILFQNRRGYAPMLECHDCAYIPKCENCDVSLTYHKRTNTLTCHYCGYTRTVPHICPACGGANINVVGYGTERIEDDIESVFPDYEIARMDLDTTRTRHSQENIINSFSSGKTKILVGTQMVTKGLDFDSVSLVGVLNADSLISFPDFRAHERAYQMLEQVAGRAGRKNKQGKVLIQTYNPDEPILQYVTSHNYDDFYNHEINERQQFNYPPFTRIINIYIKHRDEGILNELATVYSDYLRKIFEHRVLGPDNPLVARIQNLYIRKVVLKMELEASPSKVKQILRDAYESMMYDSRFRSAIIYYDVDPM